MEWKQNKISEVRNVIQDKDKSKLYALLRKFQRKELASNSILPSQWNDHFKNVLCGHERINTRVILHNYRYINELDAPFTMDELNFALRELKNNKAPRVDGVPAEIYKHAYNNPHIAEIWLDILNKLFAMGEYYIGWDTSIMHTIFKNKGSKEDPDNYRGIALAPILSKVYSKLLYERLKVWAFKNNKVSSYQAGFRPGFSTVDNIFVLDHLINKYLGMCNLYCVFIDFKKAFDTVNRKKLWARLWQIGCTPSSERVCQSREP